MVAANAWSNDRVKKVGLALVLIASAFAISARSAHAATLSLSPATRSISVGQTFSVNVYVSSPDQSMNAASGDLSFPTDKLQVLSISTLNSIISLWIRQPSFTNSVAGGDVNFQGIVLNPGFTGVDGNIITVTFEAVGQGTAPIAFSSGAVLANDGNGTNILNGLEGSQITIGPRVIPPPSSSASSSSISSSTVVASTTASSTSVAANTVTIATTTAPSVPVRNWLKFITEWWLIALIGLLLLAAIVCLAIWLIYAVRKWRARSARSLVSLEEALRNDLKRIEKELGAAKRGRDDPERKAIEHVATDIKKDIEALDDLKDK